MDELRAKMATMHNMAIAQLNFGKSILLLKALKAGTVKIENVFIDGDNWNLVEIVPPVVAEVVPCPDAA